MPFKSVAVWFALLGLPFSTTQASEARAESCPQLMSAEATDSRSPNLKDNLRDLDFIIDRIESSYAGYATKVDSTNKDQYLRAVAQSKQAARCARDDEAFLKALNDFLEFFKDGHTSIVLATEKTRPEHEALFVPSGAAPDEQEAKRLIPSSDLSSIAGIWRLGDDYKVAVVEDKVRPNTHKAIVLSTGVEGWKPGDVKAVFTGGVNGAVAAIFRRNDKTIVETSGILSKDGLALELSWPLRPWVREWPQIASLEDADRRFATDQMFMRRISPSTLWLRLPDFSEDKYQPLQSLLQKWAADIDATPNLIIDLRQHYGGTDIVYTLLRPLYYTKPIYLITAETLSSPVNIRLFEEVAEDAKDLPKDFVAQIRQQIKMMKDRGNGFINTFGRDFIVAKEDNIRPSPRRIGVLIDDAISSGEQMILELRQSRKTTLFGKINTRGVLDYSNVVGEKVPSGRYFLTWATSRSLRLPGDPVDEGGIAPDVRIPTDTADPVAFVQRWLERQVD